MDGFVTPVRSSSLRERGTFLFRFKSDLINPLHLYVEYTPNENVHFSYNHEYTRRKKTNFLSNHECIREKVHFLFNDEYIRRGE